MEHTGYGARDEEIEYQLSHLPITGSRIRRSSGSSTMSLLSGGVLPTDSEIDSEPYNNEYSRNDSDKDVSVDIEQGNILLNILV